MRIKKIILKDGREVAPGKFTVLVGPNNVGKSRTLRDILMKMTAPATPTVLIQSLELAKPADPDSILTSLGVAPVPDPQNINQHLLRGMGATAGHEARLHLESFQQGLRSADDESFTGLALGNNIGPFFVSYMDASSRLSAAGSTSSFDPRVGAPTNLLQALFKFGENFEKKLGTVFNRTFGMEIRLDYSGMQTLLMRIAKEFPEIPEDPRKAFGILEKYDRLDEQGDGYRSFVGVVLSVLLAQGRIVLLDEPEAFLHPAQARALGRWLAEYSKVSDGQIIVATHNANFLSGIVASTEDVDLYRLNRHMNVTSFTKIEASVLSELVRSPLLLSQRVLEAIFFRGVAVCEADADRAIYETVSSRTIGFQEILFVHAHNKQTLKPVVGLLKAASIPVCAIADIDLLNSLSELLELAKALDPMIDEAFIADAQRKIASSIEGRDEGSILNDTKASVRELLGQLDRGEHTLAGTRGALNRIYRDTSRWAEVKKVGLGALHGETRSVAESLLQRLRNAGLFVVPVGVLESWMNVGTSRKNRWIIKALEELSINKCPEPLKEFIQSVGTYLGDVVPPQRAADAIV